MSKGSVISISRNVLLFAAVFIAVSNLLFFCKFTASGFFSLKNNADQRPIVKQKLARTMQGLGGEVGPQELKRNAKWSSITDQIVLQASLHNDKIDDSLMKVSSSSPGLVLRCRDAFFQLSACEDLVKKEGICRNALKPAFAITVCPATCNTCDSLSFLVSSQLGMNVTISDSDILECKDTEEGCKEKADAGLCKTSPKLMLGSCRSSCGFCSSSTLLELVKDSNASQLMQPPGCVDSIDICPYLQGQLGLCSTTLGGSSSSIDNAQWWMPLLCRRTCGLCLPSATEEESHNLEPEGGTLLSLIDQIRPPDECKDYQSKCEQWKNMNPSKCPATGTNLLSMNMGSFAYMAKHCKKTCGLCSSSQAAIGMELRPDLIGLDKGKLSVSFFEAGRISSPSSSPPPSNTAAKAAAGKCTDLSPSCVGWAKAGECEKNPGYMKESCSLSCNSCGEVYIAKPLTSVMLGNGRMMPTVGFGTAGLGDETFSAVTYALRAGYKHFDSAQGREWYREDEVGRALTSEIVNRSELFLTTKIHPKSFTSAEEVSRVVVQSLVDLKTDYIDLVLLHYPMCWKGLPGCEDYKESSEGGWRTAWLVLEEFYSRGKVRSIGISNFFVDGSDGIKAMLEEVDRGSLKIKPQVVQAHLDPFSYWQSKTIVKFCNENGIQFQAYSSLGTQAPQATGGLNGVLESPLIKKLSKELGRSPAQVTLRWALQEGAVVLPRSRSEAHVRENLDVYSFQLNADQMSLMRSVSTKQDKT